MLREDGTVLPKPFDEVWNLVKPVDGTTRLAARRHPATGMNLPDPADAPARLANRILDDQELGAREAGAVRRARVHAGRRARSQRASRIRRTGKLETAPRVARRPISSSSISPLAVPSFLANPARWNEFVREEGDAELGGALKELARTLPWFVEAAFAKALGPVAGQRVADAGRRLLAFPEYAAQRVTESVGQLRARRGRPARARRADAAVARRRARGHRARRRAASSASTRLSARVASGKPQPLQR